MINGGIVVEWQNDSLRVAIPHPQGVTEGMFLHREYGYTKAEKTREVWVGSGRVRSGRPDPHLVLLSCFFFASQTPGTG